jgi:hypothetical protein
VSRVCCCVRRNASSVFIIVCRHGSVAMCVCVTCGVNGINRIQTYQVCLSELQTRSDLASIPLKRIHIGYGHVSGGNIQSVLGCDMYPLDVANVISEVVARVSSGKSHTNATASIIEEGSMMGTMLQNLDVTKYVHEAEFRFLHPGGVAQYLATTSILNCIAIFVHSSDGIVFCAHLCPAVMITAVFETECIRRDGIVFPHMMKRLKHVFNHVKPSQLCISLVGGWSLADQYDKLKDFYPNDKEMWTFSSIVHKFISDTVPGSFVDVSHLNRFEGLDWADRTTVQKMERVALGEAFRIVAIDSTTGTVSVQTTDMCDLQCTQGVGVNVPSTVMVESIEHLEQMHQRYHSFNFGWDMGDPVPEPVLQEYIGIL